MGSALLKGRGGLHGEHGLWPGPAVPRQGPRSLGLPATPEVSKGVSGDCCPGPHWGLDCPSFWGPFLLSWDPPALRWAMLWE